MNITIRKAGLEDLKELQNLFISTIENTCSDDYNTAQIGVWKSSITHIDKWQKSILEQYFLIAEIEDKIVGFVSLKNGNHIDLLYTHHDYQRKGIASLLYDKIKKKSIKLNHQKLNVHVSITALSFFKTKDFHIVSKNEIYINDILLHNFKMSQ